MDVPFDEGLWVDSEEDTPGDDDLHDDFEDVQMDQADSDPRKIALSRIENLVLSFITQLSGSLPFPDIGEYGEDENGMLSDSRVTGSGTISQSKKITLQLADRSKMRSDASFGMRSLYFPRNGRGSSAKPIAQLFKVLDIIHKSSTEGVTATKRDIYYRDVPLFKSQSVVDRLVDDLAATFHLERSDLSVRATSKGLVCGSVLVIHYVGGETVHVKDCEGTLIAAGEGISHFEASGEISWVIIIEKDAVFQTLCRLKLTDHPSMPGRGIMITGKGYPDMATRQLVKMLSDNLPSTVPILALVDADPYGIDILSVYKFGSFALKHEVTKLAASRVGWAGIRLSELNDLNIDRDALIPISQSDQKKALAMLRRSSAVMPWKWKKELMHMLHSRRKAEIEILSSAISPIPEHFAQLTGARSHQTSLGPLGQTSTTVLLNYLRDKIVNGISRCA